MSFESLTHEPCEHCGGPVIRRRGEKRLRFIGRKYCCHQCFFAKRRGTTSARQTEWPKITDDALPPSCFWRHNITPGDGWPLLAMRPETHVERAANS